MTPADVAVCVPSWGRPDLMDRFLASLHESPCSAVYWLQNEAGRERAAFDELETRVADNVEVFRSAENLGAAGGTNYLVERALADGHEWLALCDDDIMVGVDTFARIVAQTPEQAAVSGCVTSRGGLQTWDRVEQRHDGLLSRDRGEPIEHYDERLRQRGERRWEILPAKAVAFSLVLVPAAAWRDIGPLDDSFGVAFGEDNDWCHRARLADWQVGYTTEVAVHHDHGGSTTSEQNQKLRAVSARRVRDKWGRNV